MKKQFFALLTVFSVFTLLSVATPANAAQIADSQKSEATVGFYEGPRKPDTEESNQDTGHKAQYPQTGSKSNASLIALGMIIVLSTGMIIYKTNKKEEEENI